MYPMYLGIDPSKKPKDPLATYARLEYGTSDAAWLLASVRKARGRRFGRVRRWREAARTRGDAASRRDVAAGGIE